MKNFQIKISRIAAILLLNLFIFTSLPAQDYFKYYSNDELWEKGYEAYRQGNFKDATLFLYAYSQRTSEIYNNKREYKEIIDALEYITQYVVIAADVGGDIWGGGFKALSQQQIVNRPGLTRKPNIGSSPSRNRTTNPPPPPTGFVNAP